MADEIGDGKAGLQRRALLKGSMLLGLIGPALAQTAPAAAQTPAPDAAAGGELLIRGGQILTMDPSLPDLAVGDVHVAGGRIVAVGERIEAPGAEVVDATGTIVMPGFVDSHSHYWNAFLRGSVRGDDKVRGYFPTTNRAAPLCTPEDALVSARFGMLEALLSGTTTANNFSHNTRSPAHADAEIEGAREVGIRSRFSYGTPGRGAALDTAAVGETVARWRDADERLTLGVNLQTPPPDLLAAGGDDPDFAAQVAFAKGLGLPVSLHYGNTAHGLVGLMERGEMLGPDILLIHMQGLTPEERETLVARDVRLSMAPAIEMPYSTVRNGYIQFAELEALGANLSLSVDASSAMATADFFTVMRALQWAHKQRADTDLLLTPKRIVELATIGGAKALLLDERTGSLTPGKQADIILVRKNDLNIAPVIDPYYSLVYSGNARNVSTVIVGGEVLVEDGRHRRLDVDEVVAATERAGRSMHERLEKIIAEGQENQADMNRKG